MVLKANVDYPKISIVTPSFNQGKYLEKTILSVTNQNYPNLEYIVIDGGSTDESVEILKRHEKQFKYWVSEADKGQANAINKGFTYATGDLFGWLNSDDVLMPNALYNVVEAAKTHATAGVFVGGGQIVDHSGKVVYKRIPEKKITLESIFGWMDGNDFMQPSCFFKNTVWRKCGPLNENIHIALDVDLWIRIAKKGYEFVTMNDLISTSLRHEDAKTEAFKNLMTVDCAIVIIKNGGEHAVRKHLEEMAKKLSWYEPNYKKIMENPLVKILKPFGKAIIKPAVDWKDVTPGWLNDK